MKIKKERLNRRGQVSVFVILAILIIAVLILLFSEKTKISTIFTGESPLNQIERCIQESAKDGIDILSLQGGAVEPKNYYLYQGNKVEYICYNQEYYKLCVMQKPMLKEDVQRELKNYLNARVNDCVNAIKQSYDKKGYGFTYTKPEVIVEIVPSSVMINIKSNIEITKTKTENYKDVKVNVESNLYEFILTAGSIANWEARYGDSESLAYMYYYPDLKVEKKATSDGTRIYILTNRERQDKFMFATRSFAVPPGITGN